MMNEFVSWHNDTLAEKVVAALNKNNFKASYFPKREDAVKYILGLVPAEATIGFGGSVTLDELGIIPRLAARGNPVLAHNRPGITPGEALEVRRQQLTSDVYLASTNAVTLDGQLVNTDNTGNRVGAMAFGPRKVIVVSGINKIVRDVAEADARIKGYAAPVNNKRLNRPNPCTKTGECMDCQNSSRICNITTVISKRPAMTDVHVVMIGETLGY